MFLALRAGEIDRSDSDRGSFFEETEVKILVRNVRAACSRNCQLGSLVVPTCLSTSPCRFIPYNASMQSGLSSRWLLLCKNYLRGLRFLVAGPNFFFLESVSHFGIMHACKCNDDWSSTTVDNKKKMRVLACVGNPTNRWGVNPKPKWTRDLLYI